MYKNNQTKMILRIVGFVHLLCSLHPAQQLANAFSIPCVTDRRKVDH